MVSPEAGYPAYITHILETPRGIYITLGISRMYIALRAYSCEYPPNPYRIKKGGFGMNFLKNPKNHCQIILHSLKALERPLVVFVGTFYISFYILDVHLMRYHVTHGQVLAHVPLCGNMFFYVAFTIHMRYTRGIQGYITHSSGYYLSDF